MSLIKTDAFVIHGFKYSESSKIVTLFSKEFGKFSALVKGVRSTKSRSSGVFENFNKIAVFFNKKDMRSLQVISKSECINSYGKIKSDLGRLNTAFTIAEYVNRSTEEYDANKELYNLVSELMDYIESSDGGYHNYKLFFLINLSKALGLGPALKLNDKTKDSIEFGTFQSHTEFKINKEQYETLKFFDTCKASDILNVKLEEMHVNDLCDIFEISLVNSLQKLGKLKTKKVFEEIKLNTV